MQNPAFLARVQPAFEHSVMVAGQGGMTLGEVTKKEKWFLPWAVDETYQITPKGNSYTQTMIDGSMAEYQNTFDLSEVDGQVNVEDQVDWLFRFGVLPRLFFENSIGKRLNRKHGHMLDVMKQDIEDIAAGGFEQKKVVISGASGLLGMAMIPYLLVRGHQVTLLNRHKNNQDAFAPFNTMENVNVVQFDPYSTSNDLSKLEGHDVFVNLNGKNVKGFWSKAFQQACLESRTVTTKNVVAAINQLDAPPSVFINASGSSIYDTVKGKGVESRLNETTLLDKSNPEAETLVKATFMANLAREWELQTHPLRDDVRRVTARLSPVLAANGGMLAELVLPFRYGLGGTVGPGTQRMGWVAMDDALDAFHHIMQQDSLSGGVNITSPTPVMSQKFTESLAETLNRPHLIPLPEIVLQQAGDFAKELLLQDVNVHPEKLVKSGFIFRRGNIDQALEHLLGSKYQKDVWTHTYL
eukprot:TRINITY_DN5614_c0_g1_i1.p1 TRINITY_DN5614_c0_g1~~TRINITY_DN5614_c0_g1_i1.p1  ORF type:complete len:468 (+),score=142.71 TRINITY_DN5614_c0_g1_i1:112-1515(+)